ILLILTAILFPTNRDGLLDSWRLAGLFLVAFAWMLLSMVPTLLVKSQEVSTRALYTPFAGFSLGAAAISGLVVHVCRYGRQAFWGTSKVHRDYLIPVVLLLTGVVLFLSSLTMAGVVRTYQLRWDLDQRQVNALRPLIQALPRAERV